VREHRYGDEAFGGRTARVGVTRTRSRSLHLVRAESFLSLSVPVVEVSREHDLLQYAAAVGLEAASDKTRGHFPGLSARPLAIDQAKQAVLARFSATGFEAAAVTAFALAAGSAPQSGAKALVLRLDRPFAFVAVHRQTGIPIVLG